MHREAGIDEIRNFFGKYDIKLTDAGLQKLCNLHNLSSVDELYEAVGGHIITLGDEDRNSLKEKQSWMKYLSFSFVGGGSKDKKEDGEILGPIDKKKIMQLKPEMLKKRYVLCDCCNPIPGDSVLGYIDDNGIVQVHKLQCETAKKLKACYGNRLIAVEWDTHRKLSFPVFLQLEGIDDIGVLNKITEVLSKELSVNLRKIEISGEKGLFKGKMELFVHDAEDIKNISDALSRIENVKSVVRL